MVGEWRNRELGRRPSRDVVAVVVKRRVGKLRRVGGQRVSEEAGRAGLV